MQNNGGLVLYVASERFRCDDRYDDPYLHGQFALQAMKHYGLEDVITVISLDDLNTNRRFFDATKKLKSETRLPFLVHTYKEAGVVLGYSGLEEVLEALEFYSTDMVSSIN